MVTNLQRIGIDTSDEKSMALTYSGDVRKNYLSLFRLLRRITKRHTFGKQDFYTLISHLHESAPEMDLIASYSPVTGEDETKLKHASGIGEKTVPERIIASKQNAIILYTGTMFRGAHIYPGRIKRPIQLSGGRHIARLLFISKPAAVLLNWATGRHPDDFAIIAGYLQHKMSETYTRHYYGSLHRIFHDFYTDYLARYSVTLQERAYDEMNRGSVATAYHTKKNIPDYVQEKMNTTYLLHLFEYVELDETIDLDLFADLEDHVARIRQALPEVFAFKVASLRLRKLGKHSSARKTTTGLYYPTFDNLVVEMTDISSFMHEWGHALDNNRGVLSGTPDFMGCIYTPAVSHIANHIQDKQFQSYYSMPAEVFARAFEWYVHGKYEMDIGILKTGVTYRNNPEYQCFSAIETNIITYFDTILNS